MRKTTYILHIVDRKTGNIVSVETRKSYAAFDRLWSKAVTNINPLVYKLVAITKEEGEEK